MTEPKELTPKEIRIKFEQIQAQFLAVTCREQDKDKRLSEMDSLKRISAIMFGK